MANFIKGLERNQMALFPLMVDDMISEDNIVRVIDKFVEELPLEKMGFKNAVPNSKGTNHYDAKDLLKLYLYSYREGVRSSRKIEVLCKKNVEVIWLLGGLQPDFRTISDFRKNHVDVLKNVFKELIMFCKDEEIIGKKITQDGVKIQAVNSKEKNYTLNKVDDRIKKVEQHIEKYLDNLDKMDEEEDKIEKATLVGKEELDAIILEKIKAREELEKLKQAKEDEKKELEKIRKKMEEAKVSQISLTDKDSRLMKNNGNFNVCYNNQVQVDVGSHLVVNFNAGSNPADVGTIESVTEELKRMLGMEDEVITNITDQGYKDRQDMAKCLENGIIPEVTLGKEEKNFEVTFPYEENEITEEMKKSTRKEDIRKCLRAGVIPEVYEEYLSNIKLEERNIVKTIKELEDSEELMNETEKKNFAMENNCFVKDKETDKVFCPMGETLRKKSQLKDGRTKYCNKMACKNCKNPCTISKFKELVMGPNQLISTKNKDLRRKMNSHTKRKTEKTMLITAKLTPKDDDTKIRMQTGEHTHGTMKRADGAGYFLMKGTEKVNGELAIYYTSSNIRRLENMLGVKELLEKMEGLKERIIARLDGISC